MTQRALDDVPPGTFVGLRDVNRSTVGAMIDVPVGQLTASLIGEYTSDRIDAVRSTATSTRLALSGRVYRQLVSVTSAGYARRFVGDDDGFRRLQAEQRLSAPMGRQLRIEATLSYWMWREAGVIQRFTGVGGQIEWRRGAVEARLMYDRARTWLRSERLEHRLVLDLKRAF